MSHRLLVSLLAPLLVGCLRSTVAPSPAESEPDPAIAETRAESSEPAQAEPAVAESVLAGIDVFGVHTASREEVLEALGLALDEPADVGSDVFRQELEAARMRLEEQFGFVFVKLSPISYFGGPDAGKIYVTVDVVERGDEDRLRFAPEPTGEVDDPNGLVAAWSEYEDRAWELLRLGELDLSEGASCRGGFHCALGFDHADLAPYEEQFIAEVPNSFADLRRVLRRDGDPAKRAAAAYLLAYGKDREQVIEALVPSIDDPSSLVRNNTLRVLVMAQKDADAALLPLDPILRALAFPETTDRNKAGFALAYLVEKDPDHFRRKVLHEAGDLLLEMAAMAQPNNRDPALQILRALSGQEHGADVDAWRRWLEEAR